MAVAVVMAFAAAITLSVVYASTGDASSGLISSFTALAVWSVPPLAIGTYLLKPVRALLLSADRPFWRCEATRSGRVWLVGLGERAIADPIERLSRTNRTVLKIAVTGSYAEAIARSGQ
jgi:hypothetical protein